MFLVIITIYTEKTVLWYTVKEKISLNWGNRFIYIKENVFESTKLSSIQRNFFIDHILKKCFFD